MIIQYVFSSPGGSVPLAPDDLFIPFKINLSETHPSLTLGDYFGAIRAFLLDKKQSALAVSIHDTRGDMDFSSEDIRKMVIRSEKHGALYHIASVEVFALNGNDPVKFAISTAISEQGRECLEREYALLKSLDRPCESGWLPRPYCIGEVVCKKGEILSMCVSEWFEDFHEWHHRLDDDGESQKICIWDMKRGYRYAIEQEAFGIFRKASMILTHYYNINDGSQIFPWHHAAGDFVVSCRNGKTDVRLTAVRGYDSVIAPGKNGISGRIIALVYFLLNMTVKMRIDKLDGTGETVWADDFVLDATLQGFLDALLAIKANEGYPPDMVKNLFSLLRSFDLDEIRTLLCSMLELYPEEDPNDLLIIEANLDRHVRQLHRILQENTLYKYPWRERCNAMDIN